MAGKQSAELERKKFFADPIMVSTIVVLIVFLLLFILYPLLMLLIDSFMSDGKITLDVFRRVLSLERFRKAFTNTLVLGFIVGICSTAVGLLFAYVEVYVKLKTRILEKLFGLVSMLPVVSPPFVLSLSMIMLFGRSGIITRSLLHIYDSDIYGLKGIAIVQILTFFPVCYMMLKGLLKNIDPSLEEATRDMGATRWQVFTSVTFPLLLPGLGNSFLVTFIESVADFANPMMIGGSYDTLATTIYLQVTGAYDSTGAAAMSVVLLSLTVVLFLIQKYYLESKTAATLTGKASRQRMLIEDKSVTRPLSILCGLVAAFVLLMYIMVPFGAELSIDSRWNDELVEIAQGIGQATPPFQKLNQRARIENYGIHFQSSGSIFEKSASSTKRFISAVSREESLPAKRMNPGAGRLCLPASPSDMARRYFAV